MSLLVFDFACGFSGLGLLLCVREFASGCRRENPVGIQKCYPVTTCHANATHTCNYIVVCLWLCLRGCVLWLFVVVVCCGCVRCGCVFVIVVVVVCVLYVCGCACVCEFVFVLVACLFVGVFVCL